MHPDLKSKFKYIMTHRKAHVVTGYSAGIKKNTDEDTQRDISIFTSSAVCKPSGHTCVYMFTNDEPSGKSVNKKRSHGLPTDGESTNCCILSITLFIQQTSFVKRRSNSKCLKNEMNDSSPAFLLVQKCGKTYLLYLLKYGKKSFFF